MSVVNIWIFHQTIIATDIRVSDSNSSSSSSSSNSSSSSSTATLPKTLLEAAALNSNVYTISQHSSHCNNSTPPGPNPASDSNNEESKEVVLTIEDDRPKFQAETLFKGVCKNKSIYKFTLLNEIDLQLNFSISNIIFLSPSLSLSLLSSLSSSSLTPSLSLSSSSSFIASSLSLSSGRY